MPSRCAGLGPSLRWSERISAIDRNGCEGVRSFIVVRPGSRCSAFPRFLVAFAGVVAACGAPEGFKGKIDAGNAGAPGLGTPGTGGVNEPTSGAAGGSAGAAGDTGTGA